MEKIKINLTSGTLLEKPLLTAFKNNELSYIVLDNELNGTMGLPIILVSKLEGNRLVKIADKSPEWESVKEALRKIISGNEIEYITTELELNAEDIFFSQLTLPIASFEALKNNYKPASSIVNPVQNENTMTQVPNIETPASPVAATPVQETNMAQQPIAQVSEVPKVEQKVSNEPLSPFEMVQQEIDRVIESTPEVSATPVMPTSIDMPTVEAPATPIEPVSVNNQEIANIPAATTDSEPDLTADKEAFLKACENMFDALVAKLKK